MICKLSTVEVPRQEHPWAMPKYVEYRPLSTAGAQEGISDLCLSESC